jgi:uncharacterized protein
MLRTTWEKIFKEAWVLSIILYVLLSFLRAYGFFGGKVSNYTPIMFGFIIMWFIPLVFLNKKGRDKIGIRKPANKLWVMLSPLLGILSALIVFMIGFLLYKYSNENWFITIGNAYFGDVAVAKMPRFTMFIIFTIPAMLFSPIGEELFFRGIIHESIKIKWNLKTATIVNSALFALVHILHHGILNNGGSIQIFLIPGLVWVLLMFLCSNLFTLIREKTGSIWPGVIAHTFFNLTMNFTIFFILFNK